MSISLPETFCVFRQIPSHEHDIRQKSNVSKYYLRLFFALSLCILTDTVLLNSLFKLQILFLWGGALLNGFLLQ
jgi:hypothetical protein